MKHLFLYALLSFFMLTGCSYLRVMNSISSYDAKYTEISSKNKQLRFVEMVEVGQPQFYENVKRLVAESKQEGYVLFYERIAFDNVNDTNERKARRILGVLPSEGGVERQMKPMLEKGYELMHYQSFLNLGATADVNADITANELVAEYEKRFGVIELTDKDWTTPLNKKAPKLLPAKNAEAVVLNYRNQQLAKQIHEYPDTKIMVIYGANHLDGLITELNNLDSTYQKGPQNTTENNPAYLQVLSGDSIRKSTTDYIIEDGYIDQINQFLNVRISLKEYYEIFNLNSGGNQYYINPNSGTSLRFSADFRSLSIWYSYTPTFFQSNTDEEEKGVTSGFNFGFAVVNKYWFNQFNFRYIEGFYLENTQDFDPNWQEGDSYIQKPNMGYAALEGTTGYKFNPKFSLRSVTSQTERQLKSVGTVMASTNYRFYQLKDENSPLFDSITGSTNFELGFNIGYFYNWIFIKSFYLALGASPGFGFTHALVDQSTTDGIQESRYTTGVFRLSAHTGLGYNGERLTVGIYANFSGGGFLADDIPVINTDFRNLYQVFLTYRLEVNKKVRVNRML